MAEIIPINAAKKQRRESYSPDLSPKNTFFQKLLEPLREILALMLIPDDDPECLD